MNLKPLSDNIIVKSVELKNPTKNSIILTASAKEKSQIFQVIAVGPGKTQAGNTDPILVEPGDKVITSQYAGTEVKINDDIYTILNYRDVLAVVEE